MRTAADTFRLSVPVVLALGNHDVTERDAAALWLSEARRFFPDGGFVTTRRGEVDGARSVDAVV